MDLNKNVTKSLFSPNLKLSFLKSQQKTSPGQENKKINLITEFFRTKIQRNISSDQNSRQKQKTNNEQHIEITPFFVPKIPTEAYNRWHNEEKGSLIFGNEYKSIEKEDELIKPQSFRPFTDYLEHNNNFWKERFQSENSMIGLYEKQLSYNKENKIIIEKKSSNQQLNSFRNMFKEIDEYQIKIKKLPPVRNRKIKQKIIQLDDNLNSSIVSDTSEKDNNYKLKGFWSINQNSLWKPGSREGATILLYENKLYLYGGLSNKVHSELCQLDLNETEWEWKKIKTKGDLPETGRLGHSTILWKNNLLIFGGENKFNQIMKVRECFNDLHILNLNNFEWKWIRPYGDMIESRRNYGYFQINKFFFVYGGINNYGRYFNDLYCLSLDFMKWTQCETTPVLDTDGIAFHTMCPVYRPEIRFNSIYHQFEVINPIQSENKIKISGIYIFGGKNKYNKSSNTVRILKIGRKPLVWEEIKTEGVSPGARFYHTMNYLQNLNIIVIYGGRNDFFSKEGQIGIYEDVWALNLKNLNWTKIITYGAKIPRCGHASLSIESKILVFGGLNKNNYINSDIYILELNQNKAQKMIEDRYRKYNENEEEFSREEHELMRKGSFENNKIKPKMKKKSIDLNNLNFNNFKSFLPLPRKEDQLWKYQGQKILNY